MLRFVVTIAALAALAACANGPYPGEKHPLPQAAAGSGSGEPVVSGADHQAPVTAACDDRNRRDCR
jgi:ABC-type phosphate transport system substrate-binding protein